MFFIIDLMYTKKAVTPSQEDNCTVLDTMHIVEHTDTRNI